MAALFAQHPNCFINALLLVAKTLDISEDTHSKHIAGLSKLSILVGWDQLSFLICDHLQRIQVFRQYATPQREDGSPNWSELFIHLSSKDDLLTLVYQEVCIAFAQPAFALVPTVWYQPAEKRNYLEALMDAPGLMPIGEDELPSLAAKNLYPLPAPLQNWAQFRRSKVVLRHLVTVLANNLQHHLDAQAQVVAYFGQAHLFVLHLVDKKLVFSNGFSYHTAKDALYFILAVYEQFQLSRETITLWLGGALPPGEEISKLLAKYLRHCRYLPAHPAYVAGQKISHLPAHQYFAHTAQLTTL